MLTTYFLNIFSIILLCTLNSFAELNSTLDLPIIKKCFCKANEALSESEGCIEKSPLHVQIWNSSRNDVDVKNITSLHSKIEPLRCANNSLLESESGFAFISEDGKLMQFSENDTDEYCIENVINDNGKISQMSKKCVLKHSVNLCCEIDEYMDSSNRCTNIPNSSAKTMATDWLNKFIYIKNDINCNNSEKVHEIFPKDVPMSTQKGYLGDYDMLTQGNFCLGMYGDENELYPGVTFCASSKIDSSDIYPPEVPHCCYNNEAFDIEKGRCVPHEEQFKFPLNIKWPSKGIISSILTINCSNYFPLILENDTMHHLNPNGSLYTDFGDFINYEKYCLGIIIDGKKVDHSGLICQTDDVEEEHCTWRWDIYRTCIGISSFFLVLTLIVYMGIPDLRRRISGVCLISELTALLVSHITLIVIQMRQQYFSPSGCLAAGVVTIIFVLASFFWLNIMCYDVWSTFRVFRPFSEKVFHLKLFVKYSLYAWGIPLLVGILAIILELLDVTPLKPNFTPSKGCFFRSAQDLALQWFYLYGIILILLLINLGFFVHLAFTLITNQMENKKHLKRKEGNSTDKKSVDIENIKLHGKLFVIMGLPWVIEAFTSFASQETECYIWFLDLFNMLRGFFIFVIFVCKKSTKDKLIAAWFPSFKSDPERTSSRKISTTTLSLSSWLPSIPGRKISKVSLTSGGNINMEALKEETNEAFEEEATEKL